MSGGGPPTLMIDSKRSYVETFRVVTLRHVHGFVNGFDIWGLEIAGERLVTYTDTFTHI
jgi:hypothetical protein